MPNASVVGGSPLSFVKDGVQTGIPLSLLAIKDGVIDASRLGEPLATNLKPVLEALFASGAIGAGATSAPVVALTLRAKTPGTAGNTLKIKFSNVEAKTPPGKSTADVKITYKDSRKGLTKDTIDAALVARPGLVALKGAAAKAPAEMTTPKELAGGPPLELAIPATAGTAFTLKATGTEKMFEDVKVAIVDEDLAGDGTFTLVISLDRTETGIELGDLALKYGPLVDVVGAVAAAPAVGEIKLTGGTDPETSSAKAAEASVLSQ